MGLMIPSAHRVSDLPQTEKEEYDTLLNDYKRERYELNWKEVLKTNLDYKEVQLVGEST